MENTDENYKYDSTNAQCSNAYLWEPVARIVSREAFAGKRVIDVGCGNGVNAWYLSKMGYEVTAIDPSRSGIEIASGKYPGITFARASAYDDLAASFGRFSLAISLEVIEHCFWPRRFLNTIYSLLDPGGLTIISTPYHGYAKNLLIAVSGKFDFHFNPLWDGGHIKFWSANTLRKLFRETGFKSVEFERVGRIFPWLAKSIIAIGRK